ncbi:MAG: amino acid adenylation domain-containing protein [Verrucomicrobia bacterium]|nr:MAG: amino acid adenylation domain-containing protein [Verrucomicrobiota bacterium]TAE87677.1 MAG: amino acid adenylation domain-containing protein [Verrucomicrobiota bacterium]TAF25388.1 MAG: amino acid adenylation domain-containing protein [Verrucomicrobiota bacterium]TAF41175.1 MAG: amino acid adenylation domain-containing protein [Verrucomicrobiota bacterium]
MNEEPAEAIAIIGMSGRFPGADHPDEFWENLIAGKDSISRFPARSEGDGKHYVGARGILDRADLFDASFFGIHPAEAELMDPQHRVFLECAWEAIEDAGYDPHQYPGMIGVYAGLSLNTYLLHHLGKGAELARHYQVAEYATMLGNDKDFMPVRVSYKLNLRGPSMSIQTACSTSLVAICQAATALLTYQCDMALAGGVSISFPQERDYLYTEDAMVSGNGAVRAFDEKADGTVFGHGCGLVLLKRLSEAISDRDPILAVIKGWAVNNDGADKVGFAAPGLKAQAEVISLAHAAAGIHPSRVSYVEAHGTGTPLGDPIEVAALTRAFREGGSSTIGHCALGTAKTHIGHLDCAAGVTGLIKTIQQLRHEKIPALLHFNKGNPNIDFANSPFVPVAKNRDWPRTEQTRIAGVSAFGVGGTNAHIVVEEAPAPLITDPGRAHQLLVLSAKSSTALERMSARLADHLERQMTLSDPCRDSLADIAFTLATGRKPFACRRAFLATHHAEAIAKLREPTDGEVSKKSPRFAFWFSGSDPQSKPLRHESLLSEPAYRNAIDEFSDQLPERLNGAPHHHPLHAFAGDYALAKLWLSWGLTPSLFLGQGLGQELADAVDGKITLETFIARVATEPHASKSLRTDASNALLDDPDLVILRIGSGTIPHNPDHQNRASERSCIIHGSPSGDQPLSELLAAAGALWRAGISIDWKACFGNAQRARVRLPTYPFDRQSYWIDRSQDSTLPPAKPEPFGQATPLAPNRPLRVADALRALVLELSGTIVEDDDASFAELGFDSLFFTQVVSAIHSRFGVQVPFRRLLGDLSSLTTLARHLDASVAIPEAEPHQIAPATKRDEAFPSRADHSPPKNAFTPSQQKFANELVARYARKSTASQANAWGFGAHGADVHREAGGDPTKNYSLHPIVSSRAKGSKIWDLDGNVYVDLSMEFGTCLFGHSPDWLLSALSRHLESGVASEDPPPITDRLAKKICELTRMDRARFYANSKDAISAAIQLARRVTGRSLVARFTRGCKDTSDDAFDRNSLSGKANLLLLDYASPSSIEILKTRGQELAAVLIEPAECHLPDLQLRDFLRQVRIITRASGTALLVDELVTGFRCHHGGAQGYFGIKADLAIYGKDLSGGLPIAVLTGKRECMDELGVVRRNDATLDDIDSCISSFADTFICHPLVLAAADSVIDQLKTAAPRLHIELAERVDRLCRTINRHFAEMGVPIRLHSFSSHAWIEHPPTWEHDGLLVLLLRDKGVHVRQGCLLHFSTAHDDDDLDHIIHAFITAVAELQSKGFFPDSTPQTVTLPTFPRIDTTATTAAQREIFHALIMGDEANLAFNQSQVIRFIGTLSVPALRTALLDLIVRHPALRSSFSSDGAMQIFHTAPRQIEIREHDLSALDATDRNNKWAELRKEETSTTFDLVHGPLFRLQLARFTDDHHELLVTAHHLVCDGWSFGVILADLAQAYNARKLGQLPHFPAAMSFASFARLQESHRDSPERLAAERYWTARFTQAAPTLELPTDRSRPPMKTFAGAMETMHLAPGLYARLKQSSPQLGGTLFSTLLATFATLLHRLTGQDDLVIGVPAASQARIGREDLVGHCLNFLPLRLQTTPGRSFKSFATEVKEQVLAAQEHHDFTLGSLLENLRLPRDASRLPLVNAMFNIDQSNIDHIHFDGLAIDIATNAKQHVNFDLFFNLVQSDERMTVECEYNPDLHDAATIRRWLACFEQLIDSAISHSDLPLQSLPILNTTESQLVLHKWNATTRDYPRDAVLHELVAEIAARTPEKIAIRCLDQTLTYSELEQRASAIAAHLQGCGVAHGDLVGIHLERSCDMIAGLLGILKCGAAYVPLDPSFPSERLGLMIADAGMELILSQTSLHRELPNSNAQIALIDAIDAHPQTFTRVEVSATDLAYVIFTSGSTGRPKGVRIPHRSVVNLLHSMHREPGLTHNDVLLAVTTLSFDIAALEFFLPLITGAQVVIATREVSIDGHRLASSIADDGITFLQATPITWRLLLEAQWNGKSGFKALIGGEAVPRDLINRLAPLCGEIWNVYGPTETTIWSTIAKLSDGRGPVSIGHPINNTQIFIVNDALQPQPIGIPGELLIGGDGLADGYHDLDELTADRFISHLDRRLYRSGDLARWNADGSLECLGRMDHQVKVRGFRIELGDIESHLEQHPSVAQAIVHVHDERLVAYVTMKPGGPDRSEARQDHRELREHLAARLPDYMLPAAFVSLEKMPLTPNGKVDRKALPAPNAALETAPREIIVALSGTERQLAEIWQQVLGLREVGRDDDIFALGGDSILIFQLSNHANRVGLPLSPAQIFRLRTIQALAAALEATAQHADTPSPIPRLNRDAYRR